MPSRFAQKVKRRLSDAKRLKFGYDVLLDAGTPIGLASFFWYAGVFEPPDYQLRLNAKDPKIVAVAQTNALLIATHDTRMDEYVRAHQKGKKLHKCLNGLILLPSGREKQSARLRSVQVEETPLRYREIEIFWYDVWRYNLFVDLRGRAWPLVSTLCDCGAEQFEKDFRRLKLLS